MSALVMGTDEAGAPYHDLDGRRVYGGDILALSTIGGTLLTRYDWCRSEAAPVRLTVRQSDGLGLAVTLPPSSWPLVALRWPTEAERKAYRSAMDLLLQIAEKRRAA